MKQIKRSYEWYAIHIIDNRGLEYYHAGTTSRKEAEKIFSEAKKLHNVIRVKLFLNDCYYCKGDEEYVEHTY